MAASQKAKQYYTAKWRQETPLPSFVYNFPVDYSLLAWYTTLYYVGADACIDPYNKTTTNKRGVPYVYRCNV